MFNLFEKLARSKGSFGIKSSFQDNIENDHPFDLRNVHPEINDVSKELFDDGYFSLATLEAYKFLDKRVEALSGIKDTGQSLMMNAFNPKNPTIELNELKSQSDENEQEGYRFVFAGAMTGIRNPRGHEVAYAESIEECLDHLSLASSLLRKLDKRNSP